MIRRLSSKLLVAVSLVVVLAAAVHSPTVSGFCFSSSSSYTPSTTTTKRTKEASLLSSALLSKPTGGDQAISHDDQSNVRSENRRNLFSRVISSSTALVIASCSIGAGAASADTGTEVRGIDVNPFNGLIFQYRGSEFAGLKASDIDGPSVSYADFMSRLKAGEVEFVEFIAPDGDEAYVTFKSSSSKDSSSDTSKPIRIGEGYPIEQHNGYSSPSFAVRAVKNADVPYKFTVPALRALRQQ